MSLRLRLLFALAPLFIIGLVAADFGTYTALQSSLLSGVDSQLISTHHAIEQALEGQTPGSDAGGSNGGGPAPQNYLFPPGTYGELLSSSGTVVARQVFGSGFVTGSTAPVLPSGLQPGSGGTLKFLTVNGSGSVERYRVYVDSAAGGDILVAAIPLDSVDSTLGSLLILELAISGGITLIVVASTWILVRRGLRPLERMGATARSIAASDLSRRVTPSSERTEVGRLGLALNTMLAQLETAFSERAASEARLRHFVSDASHELRTPLTSMRGYAELLRRNPDMSREDATLALRRIGDETTRMGVLVDDLLLLARLDQGRPLERKPVDLEALAGDACADARAIDGSRAVALRAGAPAMVEGDELRLRQALGNVLRNALVHTPAGTPVEVELTTPDGLAVIEVVDHGPGIPHGQADRIFERFHRADPARSGDQGGSGLGLSITAAVVAAHGGSISVRETPGGGATFRLELPRQNMG